MLPAILEVQNITGAVRKFRFPEEFLSQSLDWFFPEQPVAGDHAEIDVLETTPRVPRFVSRGGSAVQRPLSRRSQILVRMPYIKESFFISSDLLNNLRGLGTPKAMRAVDYIAQELEESARAIARAKEMAIWRALSTNYQLVIDDTLYTIESPYAPENTPDVSGTAPWSNPNTDIRGQLREWNDIVLTKTGRTLRYAFLNATTAGYVLNNNLVRNYLAGTETGAKLLAATETFELFGLTWVVWDQWYNDPWDGTQKKYIPDNTVILVPNTPDWSEFQIGEVAYIDDNGEERVDHGPVSYTVLSTDPVGRRCYTVWCGLPVVKIPDCVIIAKVA